MLMAALQYVDKPDYSAVIIRRTFKQLAKPGAIMDRAHSWLAGKAKWLGTDHKWTFPSGATLIFGHMDSVRALDDYQGSEYHFVGFDEVAQFTETQYRYLFSRLRKSGASDIPIRMRATANPDGIGMLWVRDRFVPASFMRDPDRFLKVWGKRGTNDDGAVVERLFVPARMEDNIGLDQVDYRQGLMELDAQTRARLLHGDWSTFSGGKFNQEWFRRYDMQGDMYRLATATGVKVLSYHDCIRFMVIDPAGTSQEVAAAARGREPSYTAIVVLDMVPRTNELIVVDVVRFRAEFPEVCLRIQETRAKHRPAYVAIEDTSIGRAIIPMFNRIGLTVKPLSPGTQDKLTRAAEAMVRAEQGKIFLPAVASWRDNFLAELVQWTGHPDEPFDQGDCLAYAAKIAAETADNQQQSFVPWGIGRIGG